MRKGFKNGSRKQKFTLEDLIMMLGDQMNTVYRMADEALPLAEQLKLLDMLGKTCSRLASLIEQQRKSTRVMIQAV